MKKDLKVKIIILVAVLFAAAGQAIASIGIVQRWHGTIEADNIIAEHFIGGGQAAIGTPVAGTGCGTSSVPTSSGTDASGTVGITCGTTGVWQSTVLTESFKVPYQNNAACMITPANRATAQLAAVNVPFTAPSVKTGFTIVAGSAALPAGTFLWDYDCSDKVP